MEAKRLIHSEGRYNIVHTEVKKEFGFYHLNKRFFDLILSIVGLILVAPVLVLVGIIIKLDSKGPIIFAQERMGLNGKVFKIYKLRSMRTDAEKNGPQWADKEDPRVTRVGKFIRNTRIDELPQLFNVIKGDMSLIGPRPERPIFVEEFSIEIPGFKDRLQVKPGLSGWAQINGGYDISPKEKLEYDMFYIKNMSVILDMKIVFKTVKIIFTGEGAR